MYKNNFASAELGAEYTQKIKEYKRLQNFKKDEYKNLILEKLKYARDSSSFWKIRNKFRLRAQVTDHIVLSE